MRYLAISACAATFWLSVATVRLIMHGATRPGAVAVAAPLTPAPRVETTVSPLPIIENVPPRIQLTRGEVIRGLEALQPKINACGLICGPQGITRYRPPASVLVRMVILEDGSVSSAEAKGMVAGTGNGRCIEEIVMAARFARSTADMTIYHRFSVKWRWVVGL